MSDSTPTHRVHVLDGDDEAAILDAADAVRAGECIVVPTDTVYGIGADAFSADAVGRLLAAKRRGRDMPPPVLIAERSMLRALAADVPSGALALARRHWPGALTIVLKAQRTLRLELGETGGTVAVRVPDHDALRALLRRTGPLAVSSANVSGQPAATTCDEAVAMLGDEVAVYLDGGATAGGTASTIVDFSRDAAGRVLRQGAIDFEVLREDAPDLQPEAVEPAAPEPEPEREAEPEAVPEPEASTDESPEPAATDG